jgi:hypothetical protein
MTPAVVHLVYASVIAALVGWQLQGSSLLLATSLRSDEDSAVVPQWAQGMVERMHALQDLVVLQQGEKADEGRRAKLNSYLDALVEQQREMAHTRSQTSSEQVSSIMDDDGDEGLNEWIGLSCSLIFFGSLAFTVNAIFGHEIRCILEKRKSTNVPLGKLVSYRLDYWFSSSPWSKIWALLLATWFLIGLGGVLMFIAAFGEDSFSASLFKSWVFVADSAAHTDENGWWGLVVSLTMTIAGMLVFGFLIGIVSDVIGDKVDQLKQGKSSVIESDHVLMLNWSEKALNVMHELAVANESEGGGVIVVLSELAKEEVEGIIEGAQIDLRGTSVVVRSGNPALLVDLEKVSATLSKCVVVLADSQEGMGPDESDAKQLRIVLALLGMDREHKKKLKATGRKLEPKDTPHYVVELCDIDNEDLFIYLGGDIVETVVAHDLIGRMMIQCARQPGLARVMDSLLGFEGDEFYCEEWPDLVGETFDAACYWFPDAVCVGIRRPVEGSDIPEMIVNPHSDEIIREGDQMLVIAEDNDTYTAVRPTEEDLKNRRDVSYFASVPEDPEKPERLLFAGWRRDIDDMVVELDGYVAKGTTLVMLSEVPVADRFNNAEEGGLDVDTLVNLKLQHVVGNRVSRRHLERLALEKFDSVLILADEHLEGDVQKMDSFSLSTLLLVNDICKRRRVDKESEQIQLLEEKMQADLNMRKWKRLEEQSDARPLSPTKLVAELAEGGGLQRSQTLNLIGASPTGVLERKQDPLSHTMDPILQGRFKFRTQRSGRMLSQSSLTHTDTHTEEEVASTAASTAQAASPPDPLLGKYERRGEQPYSFVHRAITPSPSQHGSPAKKKKKEKEKAKKDLYSRANKSFPSFYPAPTRRSRGLAAQSDTDDSASGSESESGSDSEPEEGVQQQQQQAAESPLEDLDDTKDALSAPLHRVGRALSLFSPHLVMSRATSREYYSGASAKQRMKALKSAKSHLLSRDDLKTPVVISEILDHRTKSLIESAGVSDYVASNELVSKVGSVCV